MSFDFKNTMSLRNKANQANIGRKPPIYAPHNHITNTQITDSPSGEGLPAETKAPNVHRRQKPVK